MVKARRGRSMLADEPCKPRASMRAPEVVHECACRLLARDRIEVAKLEAAIAALIKADAASSRSASSHRECAGPLGKTSFRRPSSRATPELGSGERRDRLRPCRGWLLTVTNSSGQRRGDRYIKGGPPSRYRDRSTWPGVGASTGTAPSSKPSMVACRQGKGAEGRATACMRKLICILTLIARQKHGRNRYH